MYRFPVFSVFGVRENTAGVMDEVLWTIIALAVYSCIVLLLHHIANVTLHSRFLKHIKWAVITIMMGKFFSLVMAVLSALLETIDLAGAAPKDATPLSLPKTLLI